MPLPLLKLVITAMRDLTSRIRLYRLCAHNGDELPQAVAGAHIAIPVTLANGAIELRHYSLCHDQAQRNYFEIAVQREQRGRGGSEFIYQHFALGTLIECSAPNHHFQLHTDSSPAILIAGGIGITPLFAMAQRLALRGRRFTLHYAGRSKTDMAFAHELQQLFQHQVIFYPADEGRRLNITDIFANAPSNSLFYICGPQSMLSDAGISATVLGIHKDRVQMERFSAETSSDDKAVVLELVRSNKIIYASADSPLLYALQKSDIPVSFDCCVGDCGSCAVRVLEGEPDHRDHVLSETQKAQGYICLCVSRAKSEKLVIDL